MDPALEVDYLSPDVPGTLPHLEVPVIRADDASLEGYGKVVHDHHDYPVEIVQWPASGWRPVDPGTGDEAGTTEGTFTSFWEGDCLMGKNSAVDGDYILGWSCDPEDASRSRPASTPADTVILWHANYHPDGGQLFFPLDDSPYIVPLALPGDDIRPEDFVAFYFEAHEGLYIHPNVWHEGVFPLGQEARFFDKQGRVHARVSCNLAQEFGIFLSVPLQAPAR